MKLVCFIFLSCNAVFANCVEVPRILSVTPLVSAELLIKWDLNSESSDAIDGFKIRMWKVENQGQGYFNLVNGEQTPGLMLDYKPLEPFNAEKAPKGEPREVIVPGGESREVKIDNIKYNTLYEIRLLAYKGNESSSLSGPSRIQLIKADDAMSVVAAQRRLEDTCIATVATHVSIAGELYYHLRNIYF